MNHRTPMNQPRLLVLNFTNALLCFPNDLSSLMMVWILVRFKSSSKGHDTID